MAHVEIERQISFFSFGFARVSEVRHIVSLSFVVVTNILNDVWIYWKAFSIFDLMFENRVLFQANVEYSLRWLVN